MAKSILQDKNDRTCFLCRLLDNNYSECIIREEHHVMFGNPWKKKSEHYGLKVYLCIPHHRTGKAAVHINAQVNRQLREIAQKEFEKRYPHELWMKEFDRNYI